MTHPGRFGFGFFDGTITTAESTVRCSYCGHVFGEHTKKYQGFWACKKGCVCVMFKDGEFPVPVASWLQ